MFSIIGSPIIFWIIRTIVLISFIFTGRWISKEYRMRSSYWLYVSPCIIIYSLAEGLRWMRGTDYFHYYQDLTGRLYTDYDEIVYLSFISLFKFTGLPYWVAFVFYSFILIISFLYLLKYFPRLALYALPLFFIITSIQSDNLIRQYFALAFVIFAIAFYLRSRYLWMVLSLIVAVNIHFAAIIPIIILIISYFTAKYYNPQRPFFLIAIFLILFFFWDMSYFSFISDLILKYVPETNTRADGYLQSSSWFNMEGSLSLKVGNKLALGMSLAKRLIVLFVYLFIIITGYFSTKRCFRFRTLFYCTYFALLIDVIRGDVEGYLRVYHWLAFLIAIIVALIYSDKRLKLNFYVKTISYIVLLVYFGYNLFYSRIFDIEPWGYAFIWDK